MARVEHVLVALALAIALVAGLQPAAAAEGGSPRRGSPLAGLALGGSTEPIVITADQMYFDYEAEGVRYAGEVHVEQGELEIDCAELEIAFEGKPGEGANMELREVTARGGVVIHQGTRIASGDEARFDQIEGKILLIGNAKLEDGPNIVEGDRLTVFLGEGRSVIESSPKKRVSAVLFPDEFSLPGGAAEDTNTAESGPALE
jgi:lipopolysaccharide export system protein LptA